MKLWEAIEEIAKDNTKVFIREAERPISRLMLHINMGGLFGGIKMVNDSCEPIQMFPMEIMDKWEESK